MTPRIFRYVVRYDHGVAPRPFDGYCTLAICKPKIRAKAAVGDWIIGFRTRCPGDVIYAMQVQEVLTFDEYWADPRFRNRRPGGSPVPDNIYRLGRDGAMEQVRNRAHGPEEMPTDVSGRKVLISQKYWYFGESSPTLPTDLVHLVHAGIGHSVAKGRRADDVVQLATWLSAWPPGVHGDPVDRSIVDANEPGCISVPRLATGPVKNEVGMHAFMNNLHGRDHAAIYGGDAFFDLDITGRQATMVPAMVSGTQCVVASYADGSRNSVIVRIYMFGHEQRCGSEKPGEICRVFFGKLARSEKMTKAEARQDPRYAPFFNKHGDFKRPSAFYWPPR